MSYNVGDIINDGSVQYKIKETYSTNGGTISGDTTISGNTTITGNLVVNGVVDSKSSARHGATPILYSGDFNNFTDYDVYEIQGDISKSYINYPIGQWGKLYVIKSALLIRQVYITDLGLIITRYKNLNADNTQISHDWHEWVHLSISEQPETFTKYDIAGAHNGIFRGKNLTSYFDSGEMSKNIANSTFKNIYPGDYILKNITVPELTYTDKSGNTKTIKQKTYNNVKFVVGGLDTHYLCGGEPTTSHHVLLITEDVYYNDIPMNPTNTTEGGYCGSDMWNFIIPNWAIAIKNAFGEEHVLNHKELLSTSVDSDGHSLTKTWINLDVNIPNENMIFGSNIFGNYIDASDFPRILPYYALKGTHHVMYPHWFWLRTVAGTDHFACAGGFGEIGRQPASFSNIANGICPYFLLI